MAKVYLDAGDSFTLSGGATVYGASGTEKLIVNTGVTGVVVDQNVERVDLPGAFAAFTYQQAGNTLKIYSGATLIATVPLQGDANGTQIVTTGGSVAATLVGGVMTLGGATVPSAAPAAVVPTTVDTSITSGSNVTPPTPTLSLDPSSVAVLEGNSGTTAMTFTVKLGVAQTAPVTVNYATASGTATAGTDFTANTGTLTFAIGETSKTVTVTVTGDTAFESNETFTVTLSNPSAGIAIGTGTATGTITNDDAAPQVLTTLGGDNVKATANGQVISGIVDANNSVSTLNAGDQVDGAGFSNVTLNVTQSVAYPGTATLMNLDTINTMAVGAQTFVATGVSNTNKILSNQSTGALTISNIPSLSTAAGVVNSTNDLTANWLPTLLTGAADTATIILENATGGGVAGTQDILISDGIETLAVQSNGSAANDIRTLAQATNADNIKTVNISGANSLTIRTALDNSITKVDASTMTAGGITVGDGGAVVNFIGSNVGNDTFNFAGITLTKDDVVDGKGQATGGMDTVDAVLSVDMSAAGPTLTAIENLRFNATANVSTLLSKATSLTTLTVDADGTANTATFLQAPGITSLVYRGDGNNAAQTFDNVTLNYLSAAGTADKLDLSFNNQAGTMLPITASNINLGNLTANGVEIFTGTFTTDLATLPTTHGTTNLDLDAANGTSFTFASAGALNLTGSTLGTAGTTGLTSFTATGVAGGLSGAILNVSTTGANATLSGADDTATITTAGAATATSGVIVSAGAGADTITVALAAALTTGSSSVVVNGGDSADILTGSAGAETLNGDAGNDLINGSGGIDVLTGGAGVDNLTGGLLADTFAYGTLATVSSQTGITLATADTIADFSGITGTQLDTIKTGTAGTGANYSEATVVGSFALALAAADTAMNGTIVYHLTDTVADGGLLFVDSDANGSADAVIVLTGITSASFAFGDIVA